MYKCYMLRSVPSMQIINVTRQLGTNVHGFGSFIKHLGNITCYLGYQSSVPKCSTIPLYHPVYYKLRLDSAGYQI